MANSINIPSDPTQIQSNYEKYKEYFADDEDTSLGQDQFLALMVEQMKNQDFMSPTDNSEYIAQMAQFSMVQQIQQMNYYTNATYATSLIGKTVKIASADQFATDISTSTGVVSGIKLNGTSFEVVVDGQSYGLKNIMEVLSTESSENETITTTNTTEETVAQENPDETIDATTNATETAEETEPEEEQDVLMGPEIPEPSFF